MIESWYRNQRRRLCGWDVISGDVMLDSNSQRWDIRIFGGGELMGTCSYLRRVGKGFRNGRDTYLCGKWCHWWSAQCIHRHAGRGSMIRELKLRHPPRFPKYFARAFDAISWCNFESPKLLVVRIVLRGINTTSLRNRKTYNSLNKN